MGAVESSPNAPPAPFDPGSWFGPSFLIERSKLAPPSPRPGTVHRTALLDQLRASSAAPVVSLTAPPGYGKSTLLTQWAELAPTPVAWLSLEPEDNDPAVLLAYIATALHGLRMVDVDVLRTRAAPGTSVAAIVARRVAATLSALGPVTLVLDHTEVLDNPQCRDAVAELALHLPEEARLVVASRGTPPVPLATLRARGAVVEVGAEDLAMAAPEARLLLAGAGVSLAGDELAELVQRTEGWPVGLYLAALVLRAGGDGRDGDFTFRGDDRLMADYLRTELLGRVPRGRVSFLTRTSVLERMSGPLCDAVLGRRHSGRVLEELEASNLLLVPLDRRREWYRYHRLFRQLLRSELDRRERDLVADLHARAADWCEGHGLPETAIAHALTADDPDRVARLVATHLLVTYASGRLETVRQWLQWFDDRDLVDRYPAVAVLGAVGWALMGQAATAERWAAAAERTPVEGVVVPDGSTLAAWRALLRAFLCRNGMPRMRRDAEEAEAGLSSQSRWRPTALGLQAVSWLLAGDADRADQVLERTVAAGEDIGAHAVTAVALAERALIALQRAGWPDAESLAARGLAVVAAAHLDEYAPCALVYAVAARVAAHGGDLGRAGEHLANAARLRPQLTYVMPFISVQALLELARAYLSLADTAGARVVLREARDILRHRPDLGTMAGDADELRATLDTIDVSAIGASSLTTAELRLVPFLSSHLSFREIGERLHISRHTVKTQAMSVYRKLGVSSRGAAIERVQAMGLLGL